jgi:hypothetical protein
MDELVSTEWVFVRHVSILWVVINKRNPVIRDADHYRLSGIAQIPVPYQVQPAFLVPRNKDAAAIGLIRLWEIWKRLELVYFAEDLQGTSYYCGQDGKLPNPTPHGYPVHARCWSLIERVIGPDAEHLEVLLQALRRRFRKRVNPEGWSRWWYYEGTFAYGNDRQAVIDIRYRDPVGIPGVKEMLENTTRKSIPGSHSHLSYPFSVPLPLELQYLIWEKFSRSDVVALHEAFTGKWEWRLPESYWMKRTPITQIFEIKDHILMMNQNPTGPSDVEMIDIDWESLCLQAEELVQTSENLQNRRRITRILEGTRAVFCSLMRKGELEKDEDKEEGEEGIYDSQSDCPEDGYDGRSQDGTSISVYLDD